MGKITLKSIADELGINPAVVTRVMKNKVTAVQVSAETKARILSMAIEKGWRGNDNIGVLVPESILSYEYYYNAFVAGVFTKANAFGIGIMSGFFPDKSSCGKLPDFLKYRNVSGVIFLHRTTEKMTSFLEVERLPYVVCNPESAHIVEDCVMFEGRETTTELLMRLKAQGYRRFILCSYGGSQYARDRIDCFDQFISTNNCCGRKINPESTEVGTEMEREVAVADSGTVFIVDSRFHTIKCLELFAKHGKKVMDDVGLVGHHTLAELHEPKLSTVKYPIAEIGAEAVSMIREKWKTGHRPLRRRLIKGQIFLNMKTKVCE